MDSPLQTPAFAVNSSLYVNIGVNLLPVACPRRARWRPGLVAYFFTVSKLSVTCFCVCKFTLLFSHLPVISCSRVCAVYIMLVGMGTVSESDGWCKGAMPPELLLPQEYLARLN